MSYTNLIQRLYKTNIFSPVKSGLENMLKLNTLLNHPLHNVPIIHVTGTNGKGSVSLKIAKSLRECGIKTGLFTSPHISSFKERIMVNEEQLSEADVESIFPEIFRHCTEQTIPATFFELTTALGLVKFHRAQCEAVVLEVGLGGRLDATNIVTPTLSIITAIQIDHTKILGDTIEKIALEKAGIMKPGVDVLVGPGCPMDVMRAEATRVGAILYTLDDLLSTEERRYKWCNTSSVSTSSNTSSSPTSSRDNSESLTEIDSPGEDIDDLNYDIAHAALKLLKKQYKEVNSSALYRLNDPAINFEKALKTRPPCRFEVFKQVIEVDTNQSNVKKTVNVDVVLDIAHNVDALRSLASKVRLVYGGLPIRLVLGMSSDKDIAACLPHALSIVNNQQDRIHCTAAKHPRAIKIAELRNLFNKDCLPVSVEMSNTLDNSCVFSALHSAIQHAAQDSVLNTNNTNNTPHTEDNTTQADAVVIVCGTAFIMSDARFELGVDEARDGEELFFSPAQLMPTVSIARDAQPSGDSVTK